MDFHDFHIVLLVFSASSSLRRCSRRRSGRRRRRRHRHRRHAYRRRQRRLDLKIAGYKIKNPQLQKVLSIFLSRAP